MLCIAYCNLKNVERYVHNTYCCTHAYYEQADRAKHIIIISMHYFGPPLLPEDVDVSPLLRFKPAKEQTHAIKMQLCNLLIFYVI